MIGWADESGSNMRTDPGTYILGVVLADEASAPGIRNAMSALRLKGQHKLHWRDEDDKRRRVMAEAVAELPVMGLVVVRHRLPAERPERRRRKCLEQLVPDLTGCSRLIAESRGPADDARDRQMLDALRRRKTAPAGLHLDHVAGPADPGLWVADALCGMVVEARTGAPAHLELITDRLAVTMMDV